MTALYRFLTWSTFLLPPSFGEEAGHLWYQAAGADPLVCKTVEDNYY
jgi:hypothetical protein